MQYSFQFKRFSWLESRAAGSAAPVCGGGRSCFPGIKGFPSIFLRINGNLKYLVLLKSVL